MNKLSLEDRTKIISCLVEGCSMRSTERMTGFSKKGIVRLQKEIGKVCAEFHDKTMRNVNCKVVQVDEIWTFTFCKQRNVPEDMSSDEIGDTWTWISLDSESKAVINWHVGKRDGNDAHWFIGDLKARLAGRVQLTSDGHKCYVQAVEEHFGAEVDFSQLVKIYGKHGRSGPDNPTEVRYSPPQCIGSRKRKIIGNPVRGLISTSHIERQNLTLRMNSRRFTRLTNAVHPTVAIWPTSTHKSPSINIKLASGTDNRDKPD